jgi:hypothetical protein
LVLVYGAFSLENGLTIWHKLFINPALPSASRTLRFFCFLPGTALKKKNWEVEIARTMGFLLPDFVFASL